jgi:hypothetical protein
MSNPQELLDQVSQATLTWSRLFAVSSSGAINSYNKNKEFQEKGY